MNLEERIVKFSHELVFDSLDEQAIATAKRSIIDILGVSLAGSRDPGIKTLHSVVSKWGGTADCGVLGYDTKLPPAASALINGASARVLDFDDVVDPLGTHPSVAIFPPLLTVLQMRNTPATGRELLTAMVLGQDLSVRFARARQQTLLESGRYDMSKILAATAATAHLYGLNETQMHQAMGIAYTSAVGETQCMIDGASTVFYQQGLVAENAIKSVLLAEQGFSGATRFLKGRWGYYSAFEPNSDTQSILKDLGSVFTNSESIAFKPYPTCRPNISAASLAMAMVDTHNIQLRDIERVEVTVNQQIYDLVCAPIEQKRRPTSVVDARFSMAYNIACAIVSGNLFIDDFTKDAITRKDIIKLCLKIDSKASRDCDIPELGTHGKIRITMLLTNGSCITDDISYPKGNAKNPMSSAEIEDKFAKCIAHTENTVLIENTNKIIECIHNLDKPDSKTESLVNLIFV